MLEAKVTSDDSFLRRADPALPGEGRFMIFDHWREILAAALEES
jgi:hypothetical protein